MKRSIQHADRRRRPWQLWLPLSALLLVSIAGCGTRQLTSQWLDREVVVDGAVGDWNGATEYVNKAEVTVGVLNDDTTLYLSLAIWNRRHQLQVMTGGLTLWLDPTGEKVGSRGLRFPVPGPIPRPEAGERQAPLDGADPRDPNEVGGPAGPIDPGELWKRMAGRLDQVELLNGEAVDRQPISEVDGVEVAADYSRSRLLYELKLPLAGEPLAIGIEAGQSFLLGLEAAELDSEAFGGSERRPPPGTPPPGMGGGRGGAPPGGAFQADPIEAWVRVQTASAPGEAAGEAAGAAPSEARGQLAHQ